MTRSNHSPWRATLILGLLLFAIASAIAQPGSYYNSVSTSSSSFVTYLHALINPHTRITYDNFDETNVANFASRDTTGSQKVVTCVYSGENYVYTPPFAWGHFSREHTWCQSWMPSGAPTSSPEYSDQHHLFPTEQNHANGVRSNHPEGNVVSPTSTYLECKLGTDANGHTVFEPRASHKGDFARALLYMSVCYNGASGYDWTFNHLNTVILPGLSEASQDVSLLLQWSKDDPPDAWEVSRNNYIQSIQGNRNPFVDHPEWVNYIDFNDLSKLSPTYSTEPTNQPTSMTITAVSGVALTVNWSNATTGSQAPSGYLLELYHSNDYFIPADGSAYSNDADPSEGREVVNISNDGTTSYQFTGLESGVTYYVHMFSYNGSSTQINYKIDGTIPTTNATTTPGGVSTEPESYATTFSTGTITSSSIQLTWTDASDGSQAPSGYLLKANTTNVFTDPSDGAVYSDDNTLGDGSAVVNIVHPSSGTYIFSGLQGSTGYYFKIYSYNGTGAQRNYKIDGTVPTVLGTTSAAIGGTPNGTIDFGTTVDGTAATTANTGFGGVRIGTGSGSFMLKNPSSSIGTAAVLQGVAPTGGSVNSVGVTSTEFGTASTMFTIKFDMYLTGGNSGTWYFFAGNGASFGSAQSAGFTGAQVFTGMQFIFGASNTITANNRNSGSWVNISGSPFAQNALYTVAIVGNNSAGTVTYGGNSVAANTYDLFINGVLVGDDLPKALLPATTNINAFRFYGENSAGNVATISLDNILWYNTIDVLNPLPVEISSFAAHGVADRIVLEWATATELSNFGFDVERRTPTQPSPLQGEGQGGGQWHRLSFVEGHGTTNAPRNYSFADNAVSPGKYLYRLKQIDRDGKFSYSNEVEGRLGLTPAEYSLSQNYPNPFNPTTTIRFAVRSPQRVLLKVYDILGREVRTIFNGVANANELYSISFEGVGLSGGVYYYRLFTEERSELRKMVMIK